MFNSVEFVRQLCRDRKIPVSQLERDCGFANGYLNPKKMTTLPYDRARTIAAYLDIDLESIFGTRQTPEPPAEAPRFRDGDILFALSRGGESEITEEMYQEVVSFARFVAQREADKKQNRPQTDSH